MNFDYYNISLTLTMLLNMCFTNCEKEFEEAFKSVNSNLPFLDIHMHEQWTLIE